MEQNANTQPIENIVKYEDGKAFTTSLIVADVFEKEHKEKVRNYVLNRCDVDSLDEFATERDMMKALFVLWGGVANHSLARGW